MPFRIKHGKRIMRMREIYMISYGKPPKHFKRRKKMKKGLFLVVIFVLLLSAACTAKVEQAPAPSFNTAPVSTPSTNSAPVTSDRMESQTSTGSPGNSNIKYAELIPDPKSVFMNGDMSITDGDGGTAYIFEVTGYADGEYETYILQCKERGFNDVYFETSEDFGAYSERWSILGFS